MVFDHQEPGYENIGEAKDVLGALTALYNSINEAAVENRPALPADCAFLRSTLDNLADRAPIAERSLCHSLGHRLFVNQSLLSAD
jgi:hypothetical protein